MTSVTFRSLTHQNARPYVPNIIKKMRNIPMPDVKPFLMPVLLASSKLSLYLKSVQDGKRMKRKSKKKRKKRKGS